MIPLKLELEIKTCKYFIWEMIPRDRSKDRKAQRHHNQSRGS